MFLSSYRNTSESLGERDTLWEREPTGMCFPNFVEFLLFDYIIHSRFRVRDSLQGQRPSQLSRIEIEIK